MVGCTLASHLHRNAPGITPPQQHHRAGRHELRAPTTPRTSPRPDGEPPTPAHRTPPCRSETPALIEGDVNPTQCPAVQLIADRIGDALLDGDGHLRISVESDRDDVRNSSHKALPCRSIIEWMPGESNPSARYGGRRGPFPYRTHPCADQKFRRSRGHRGLHDGHRYGQSILVTKSVLCVQPSGKMPYHCLMAARSTCSLRNDDPHWQLNVTTTASGRRCLTDEVSFMPAISSPFRSRPTRARHAIRATLSRR